MIANAGIVVFIFGNKLQAGSVVPANGVHREFEIAKANGLLLIPIGATGYVAQDLLREITDNYDTYYPKHPELKSLFTILGPAARPIASRTLQTVSDTTAHYLSARREMAGTFAYHLSLRCTAWG